VATKVCRLILQVLLDLAANDSKMMAKSVDKTKIFRLVYCRRFVRYQASFMQQTSTVSKTAKTGKIFRKPVYKFLSWLGFPRLRKFLAPLLLFCMMSSGASADPFKPEDKIFLEKQLEEQKVSAEGWATYNEHWDLGFKTALLVFGILSAVGAALSGTVMKQSAPAWLTIGNIAIGAVITGMTAFAFSTLNFPARSEVYRKKATALASMQLQLRYSNPDADEFITTLTEIYSWHDTTPPDIQIPQKALLQSAPRSPSPGT
jgi:hypothetical protein